MQQSHDCGIEKQKKKDSVKTRSHRLIEKFASVCQHSQNLFSLLSHSFTQFHSATRRTITHATVESSRVKQRSKSRERDEKERRERKESVLPVGWAFNQAKFGERSEQNERSRKIVNPSKVTAEAEPHLSYLFLHSTIDSRDETIYCMRVAKALSSHSIFTSSQLLSLSFTSTHTFLSASSFLLFRQ